MPDNAQDDDLVMSLAEQALGRPSAEREEYLRTACAGDTVLFGEVWNYVRWEERMNGFLLNPLCPPPSREHPFEPGEILDERFRIVREVARGGMGIVYEAMDEKLDRRIALKCAQTAFRNRLPPEVRHATAISHPNVCKIFEIHTASTPQGKIDFLTMEFLDGETLADRLLRGPVPEKEARALATQLCAGLDEAHRNQVIHGDLKSSNVILSSAADGTIRAVITDFGLARQPGTAQRTAQSGELGGTPDYMAPELWKGEKATVASDIFALGVILSELVSGSRPDGSRKAPAVDPRWNRVLTRCLDPDPTRRFHTAGEVAQALAPRSRRWLLGAAAAAVLAIASGVVAYQRARPPREEVRLAMLPFASVPNGDAPAQDLFRDTADRLARLAGGSRVKLNVLPASQTLRDQVDTLEKARSRWGATHVLHATLGREKGALILEAFLSDTRSRINAREWRMEYAVGETRFIPAALAGVVTETLRLPPLTDQEVVNRAARADYLKGLSYVRRDAGIDTALAFFERAVAADPDSPLTHAGLAEAQWFKYFLSQNKSWLDRATESARQAELRNPDLAPVHRIQGILIANSGQYEQAEAEYRRAIELEPGNGDAYRRLGMVYESNNRSGEALAAYLRALGAEPAYYRTYQALGSYYFNRANYGEAFRYLSKAVELAPDEASAHFALGSVFTDTGRFGDAESEFRFSIRLRETPSTLHALGLALMYEGRDQEAIPYFQSALKLSPEGFLSWMELGNCYRRMKLAREADRANRRGLEVVEAEMARNPRDGYVRSFLAYLCARLGDRRRAESEIAQALQFSANQADTQAMAAFTYEALGMREATLSVLSAAPKEVLADLGRWPDVADLRRDSRFLQLLASHQLK